MSRQRTDVKTQQMIRKLRLTARRLIHTFGEGSFRTMFHGRGIEFATLREYVPGDDIRQIEWNTTARRGVPFVKTFVEERDLSVMLVVDLSSSMEIKWESVLQLCALITSLADYHDDRIGCMGFTDVVEFYLPPAKSPVQPERILHLLVTRRQEIRKTSLSQALGFLRRVLKKHAILFIVSDFLDRQFERHMLALSRKHEIIGICVYDPIEKTLPQDAVLDCFDPESGKRLLLDAYDASTRSAYLARARQQEQMVQRTFGKARADLLTISASPKADLQLIDFLRRRQTARGPLHVS
jgi:uncharacterized protein (DUF58 family)